MSDKEEETSTSETNFSTKSSFVIQDTVSDSHERLFRSISAQLPTSEQKGRTSSKSKPLFGRALTNTFLSGNKKGVDTVPLGESVVAIINNPETVHQIATKLESQISIKDRLYLLKTYKKCFVASEAVTWFVEDLKITRLDAVELGRKMVELGIIAHVVTADNLFDDKKLFFKFCSSKLDSKSSSSSLISLNIKKKSISPPNSPRTSLDNLEIDTLGSKPIIIETLTEPTILVDSMGIITKVNKQFCTEFKYDMIISSDDHTQKIKKFIPSETAIRVCTSSRMLLPILSGGNSKKDPQIEIMAFMEIFIMEEKNSPVYLVTFQKYNLFWIPNCSFLKPKIEEGISNLPPNYDWTTHLDENKEELILDHIIHYVETDINFLLEFFETSDPLINFTTEFGFHVILNPPHDSPLSSLKSLVHKPVHYIHLLFLRILFPALLSEGKSISLSMKVLYRTLLAEYGEETKKTIEISLPSFLKD